MISISPLSISGLGFNMEFYDLESDYFGYVVSTSCYSKMIANYRLKISFVNIKETGSQLGESQAIITLDGTKIDSVESVPDLLRILGAGGINSPQTTSYLN